MKEYKIEIESPYLCGADELSIYLRGVPISVLTKMHKLGLPYHRINNIYLYDKEKVRQWLNSRKNIIFQEDVTDSYE